MEVSPSFTPLIPIERLKELDSLPPGIQRYCETIPHDDPIYSDAPQTAYEFLWILDKHSKRNPKLMSAIKQIWERCSIRSVFSRIDLPEDLKIITKDDDSIMIYRIALRHFCENFRTGIDFENKDSYMMKQYSIRAIDLLKTHIYTRKYPETCESFTDLFDLLVIAEIAENKYLHMRILDTLDQKARKVKILEELSSIREAFSNRSAEIRDEWWLIFFKVFVNASADPEYWNNFSSLLDVFELKEFVWPDFAKSMDLTFTMGEHVTNRERLRLLNTFIQLVKPSKYIKIIEEEIVMGALNDLLRSEGVDVKRIDFKLALPARSLAVLVNETEVPDIFWKHLRSVTVERKNKYDRSQIRSAVTFYPEMRRLENLIVSPYIDSAELINIAKALPETNITILHQEEDLNSRTIEPREPIYLFNDFCQEALTKSIDEYAQFYNITIKFSKKFSAFHIGKLKRHVDMDLIGRMFRDNPSIKDVYTDQLRRREQLTDAIKKYREHYPAFIYKSKKNEYGKCRITVGKC
ncbi:MAG: hypothetical protein K940chlam3_01039 [Chlamydiae bacterium]|nr:hypothetical protein [Chlamydiota bacterium]